MSYKLKIVHLGGIFFHDEITYCHVKTLNGEMGIMPRHVPIISSIQVSGLKFITHGKEVECAIAGGILFVELDAITILTSNIQNRVDIDIEEAKKLRLELENKLHSEKSLKEQARLDTTLKQVINTINIKEKGI